MWCAPCWSPQCLPGSRIVGAAAVVASRWVCNGVGVLVAQDAPTDSPDGLACGPDLSGPNDNYRDNDDVFSQALRF